MPTVEIDYPASGSTNVPRQFLARGTYEDTTGSILIQCTLRDVLGQTIATSTANVHPDNNRADSGTWDAPFSVDQDSPGASLTAVLSNPPAPNASHQATDLTIGDPTLIVTSPLPLTRKDAQGRNVEVRWPIAVPVPVTGRVCSGVGVLVTLYVYRRDKNSSDGSLVEIGPAKTGTANENGYWKVTFNPGGWKRRFAAAVTNAKNIQAARDAQQPGRGDDPWDKLAIIAAAIGRNGKHLGRVVWHLRVE